MDRRTVLALALVALVVLLTPTLFPPARVIAPVAADTTGERPLSVPTTIQPTESPPTTDVPGAIVSAPKLAPVRPVESDAPPEVTHVDVDLARFEFTSEGAAPSQITLKAHRSLSAQQGSAAIVDPGMPLLGFRFLVDRDTVDLRRVRFRSEVAAADSHRVDYSARVNGFGVRIGYTVSPDSYVVRVAGRVERDSSGRSPSFLLIDLPTTLRSFEADTLADQSTLSYAIKPVHRSAEAVAFRSLDPGERQLVTGPVSWAVAKNKYFMLAVLSREDDESVAEVQVVGGPRASRVPTHASATLVRHLDQDGTFSFEVFSGPQEYKRLQSLGRDFENSNPYGGWMQGFIQPFATIVMRVLLWMKSTLPLGYGWLLVVFGVAVRLILWPLNQGAMRTSMKMQRIQPELNAMQQKYKTDPQKLQSEMMRVYKEHDMSPFSAFAGCLPMLLPMPILFALFFVFQNTIEFRGVSFLWLHDISLKDPYYIVPLFMGVSMFVMSWVGLRGAPANPQAKMMAYVLPVVMTVMFANFASGLNLYYAVQNVAAIPQQWLIARERSQALPKKS